MTAPPSPKRFHLVLAHDLSDTDSSRESVFKFWKGRFPDALITDFAFSDGTSNVSFLNRAHALLLAIQDARENQDYVVRPDDHLPCIFICHGLGGSLVKQALVLASLDRKYGRYASDAALLVLFNTPGVAESLTTWQLRVCHLLTISNLGSYSVTSLLDELPEALERLDWSFGAIQRHHSIVSIKSKGADSKLNTDEAPSLITRGQSTIYTSADEASPWRPTPGDPTTERIFDVVSQVVKQEIEPLSKRFHGFMKLLRSVDSNDYQLEFSRPFTGSVKPIVEHDSFRDWQNLDPKAPNLLHFWMPQGIGSAAVASRLIENLVTSIPDYAIVSFSFSKQDMRTQPITTFYVSLIRQLLLNKPSLFRRVSAISDWIKGKKLSHEIFRSLLLSLLKGANPNPVICVLHSVQDCAGFPLDHIMDLVNEFRRLSNGIFKVMVVSEEPAHDAFVSHPDVCRDIDMSTISWSAESIEVFVRSWAGTLSKSRPHWKGYENEIIQKLCSPSVTYMKAATVMKLLESEKIPSTRSAALDAIEKLPLSDDQVYAAAVDHCASKCPLPLKPLLQWVLHSVRPLFINELAVITGLTYLGSGSIKDLRSNIPLVILDDLRQVKGTLVRTTGLQTLPIHKAIVPVLDEKWGLADEDADSIVLRTCLDYLEMILVSIPTISSPPVDKGNRFDSAIKSTEQQSSEAATDEKETGEYPQLKFNLTGMTGLEYDLLEYAVTNWPAHYKRARSREAIKGRILDLLSKNHEVQAWSTLYERFTDMDTEKFGKLDNLLNIGCRFGLLDIVQDVIGEVKASKKSKDILSKALNLAVSFGHEDIVSLLIKEGGESNDAPGLAAEYGFLGILQQLIKSDPAMASVKDKFGRPPFLLAVLSGNENITLYLMDNGAENIAAENSITGLQVAATTGQLSLLRKLVDTGSDTNACIESNKSSALMLAAAGGFDDIVALLLSHGAGIDDQDAAGETALYRAVKHGHASTCDLLFTAGANIHIKTKKGLSPIHAASRNGHLGILKELLERSKEFLNQEEGQGEGEGQANKEQASLTNVYDDSVNIHTPLQLAASNGYLDITQELLKYPRYNSERSRATALLIAAGGGFAQLVEELLKTEIRTVMTDTNGNSALHLATQEQYPDIVERLLRSDSGSASIFDVNSQNHAGWAPLHLASRSGRLITVQTLLRSDARVDSINSDGQTALHISSYYGHLRVVNALMDYLANHPTPEHNVILIPDKSGDTAFMIAVRQVHQEVARALIEKSTPLKPVELEGRKNALTESTNKDEIGLVSLLLDHGWNIDGAGQNGNTALHIAVNRNLLPIMELLLSRGADCNARNADGRTPLHRAIFARWKVAIQTLLEKGSDINAKDDDGLTPLWIASYKNDDDAIKALLEWNPKPELDTQRSSNGWTALHTCYRSPKITELLLKAGADPMSLNKTGDTPFLCAVRYFRGYETLQKYIDAGIDINWRDKNGKPLIHLAASFGTFGALKFLHENGADILLVGDTGETALHLAAAVADYNYTALEYLIEKGADLEADCERFGTPLMAAARNNARTTNLLLQKGAKVNAISESCASHNALQTAASEGTYDIVNALIKADADANIRGGSYGSALCASVARDYNDSKIVKLLLENEKDINYAEGPRGSALELAISRQSLEIAELFFNRDVDVNIISKGKYGTALIAAIEVGEINAVEKLLDLKADVNLFQACGESPVQIAIRKGRQNIVELLVKNGAKLDYRDNHGRGVLSHAISQQSFDLLPYLLQQEDIDINQQDDLGRTPLIHATIQGHIIMNDIIAQKPKMDLQDRWGKTALAHAVSRDYGPLVSSLIAAEADPLVRDIRGRDALYWAALQASQNTFEQVLKKLEALNASSSSFQHAVIAATNANNYEFVQQLLKDRLFPDYHKDQDGWTAPYNARFYDRWRIDLLIYRAFRGIYRGEEDSKPPVAPTQWHPTDMSRYLARQPDNISIKLDPEALLPGIEDAAMVRADHAMVPNEDGIYYFEITVVNGGDAVRASVGFCDEKANLDDMLGCQEGTWGYHGDDGNVFAGNSDGNPYGPKYGEGSVVGCGVNFGEGTAFYTHNGEVIGRASTNVQGKLYPAVSIDTRAVDCTLTARFWSDDESERKLFKFQGPYDDSKTLESSQRYKDEGGAKQGKDSDDSSFDSSDFDSD